MILSSAADAIVGSLLRTRSAEPHSAIVLLEGPTDIKLWTEYRAKSCELFRPIGKENAVKALRIIDEQDLDLRGVAAIVDPDDWLVNRPVEMSTPNLLFYDAPDLELMLLHSPALEKVLRHTVSIEDISSIASSMRAKALKLGTDYGFYRLLDARHREYNLSFNAVCFADVIQDGQINHDAVAEKLTSNSSLTKEQLLESVRKLHEEVAPTNDVCHGKDTLSILAYLLQSRNDLSDKAKIQTESNELSRTLRLAYENAYLVTTKLFARIREWECENPPYKILKPKL